VRQEIEQGLAVLGDLPPGQVYLIPARLDDCRPEDPRLREATWVDLFPSPEEGMRSIINAIRAKTSATPARIDERLALLQVRLEEHWRHEGKVWFNSVRAESRIRDLLSLDRIGEITVRIRWLFQDSFRTAKLPPVEFARFSDDGKIVIAHYSNGLCFHWKVESGELHDIEFDADAHFLVHDGRRHVLIPAGNDALVFKGGRTAPIRLVGHTRSIHTWAFDADETHVVTGSHDGTARLWNLRTRKTLWEMGGHPGPVSAVAMSPDGVHIATAADASGPSRTRAADEVGDQRIRVWDMRKKQLKALLRGHVRTLACVWDLDFDHSGQHLVSASTDGSACLWDCAYWQLIANMENAGQISLKSARFSPDGRQIVTASVAGHVIVWPIVTRLEALDARLH
jgi:WD40 repeat protein